MVIGTRRNVRFTEVAEAIDSERAEEIDNQENTDNPGNKTTDEAPETENRAEQREEREQTEILQLLKWIGFSKETERDSIVDEAFATYDDLKQLNEKDIHTLSIGFSSRSGVEKINFGLRRTKRLVSFVHWIQDFGRISLVPSVIGLTKQAFLSALATATDREAVRKLMINQSNTKSKAASPGPLVNEAMYEDWEPKFLNCLSCILGVKGVPIVYVVQKNVLPTRTGTFPDFIEQTIM